MRKLSDKKLATSLDLNPAVLVLWMRKQGISNLLIHYSGDNDSGSIDDLFVDDIPCEDSPHRNSRLLQIVDNETQFTDIDNQPAFVTLKVAMESLYRNALKKHGLSGYGDGQGGSGNITLSSDGLMNHSHKSNNIEESTACEIKIIDLKCIKAKGALNLAALRQKEEVLLLRRVFNHIENHIEKNAIQYINFSAEGNAAELTEAVTSYLIKPDTGSLMHGSNPEEALECPELPQAIDYLLERLYYKDRPDSDFEDIQQGGYGLNFVDGEITFCVTEKFDRPKEMEMTTDINDLIKRLEQSALPKRKHVKRPAPGL